MHVERFEMPGSTAAVAAALATQGGLAWLDGEGRFSRGARSFVACAPVEWRRVAAGTAHPLAVFETLSRPPTPERAARHAAGTDWLRRAPRWVGYVAYDAAWCPPHRVPPRHGRADAEVCVLARYDAVIAIEHATGTAWLVGDDEAACRALEARARGGRAGATRAGAPGVCAVEATPARVHREAIERALEHIAAGDLYQVNLARRWRVRYEGDPLALFYAMRDVSPVPLGFFLDAGDHAVLGRSMERFIDWDRRTGTLISRPIKGTVARRDDDGEAPARALRDDAKERAEHSMIVDLMRNDVGRVARLGSVVVTETLAVEPYADLAHLVSTVRCVTRASVDLRDVLEATFPPGSVTGAPKLRAVELIEALEAVPRGVYTGALGYVDREGGLSLAVAIRTAVVRDGFAVYFAGGGIVEASDPAREVAETALKAGVFLDALARLQGAGDAGR